MVAVKRDKKFWVEALQKVAPRNSKVATYLDYLSRGIGLWTFQPRPDDPDNLDEQWSFVNNRDHMSFLVGGNGCLGAEQEIYDPITKESRPIGEIDGPFHVVARDSATGERVTAAASAPIQKGEEDLYEVDLSNGQSFVATKEHRVLAMDGKWVSVGQLVEGSMLCCGKHPDDSRVSRATMVKGVHCLRRDIFYDIHVPVHNNYEAAGVWHHNSGTTTAAAYKTAKFLLEQQAPPRKNTPFWVLSNTFENTCNVCWGEKLQGMGFIPPCEIDKISWHKNAANQPNKVILKPWPRKRGGDPNKNWMIEFKTFKQGVQAMQGASIGGFWLSETFPVQLLAEILRGAGGRQHFFPGGQFAEFTPIDPVLSIEIEEMLRQKPPDWKVYRCNTRKNLPNLVRGEEWLQSMLAATPEELHETRLTGAFAVFEGQIYQGFRREQHVFGNEDDPREPLPYEGVIHAMGTDWGWTAEHAHCTVWGYYDLHDHTWTIYDEYWTVDQERILQDHIEETLDRCEQWGWPVVRRGKRRVLDLSAKPGYHANHCDSAAPGNIREYNKRGIASNGYKKTDNSVLEGIYLIKHLLKDQTDLGEPRLKIHARCRNLIREMRLYRWKRGATNMTAQNPALAKPVPLDRDDHACDSCRYLIKGEYQAEGWQAPQAAQRKYDAAYSKGVQLHKQASSNGHRESVQLAR